MIKKTDTRLHNDQGVIVDESNTICMDQLGIHSVENIQNAAKNKMMNSSEDFGGADKQYPVLPI